MAEPVASEAKVEARGLHCVADCGFIPSPGVETYALIPATGLVVAVVLIALRRFKRRKRARPSDD
ncbi:hypothetical protein [Caulobacter sp.]|uniref:hypothetical protein n=1 Tax=Caulobacter sp. TaxID=78 RepID=UPI003BAFF3B4